MPIEAWVPAGLHGQVCSGPASGADAGERNTCRSGADRVGPETYLEVLEALFQEAGVRCSSRWGKDTDSRSTRDFFFQFFSCCALFCDCCFIFIFIFSNIFCIFLILFYFLFFVMFCPCLFFGLVFSLFGFLFCHTAWLAGSWFPGRG